MSNYKTWVILFLFHFLFLSTIFSQIDVDISNAIYFQNKKPYLETSLHLVASTLTEKKQNGLVETRANVLITIKKDSTIVDFAKYGLISPKAPVTTDFIDLKRFVLSPGIYQVEVTISDQLNQSNTFNSKVDITIPEWKETVNISNISLLHSVKKSDDTNNSFFKYGNIMEPAAFNFFHSSMEKLYVFAEIYSTEQEYEEDYAVQISIQNIDSKEIVLKKTKRFSPSEKEVYLEKFPIDKIHSGNYKIDFNIINASSEILLTKSVYFQRSNPKYDQEQLMDQNFDISKSFVGKLTPQELKYNLKALAPRLHQSDVISINILLEEENIKGQQFYLHNYWQNFDPVTTEETFNQYREIAQAVDKKFYNTVGYGFETDRGYIFLKYGRPNNVITVENEPSAPPYEIWFYDKLDMTGEVNAKFLFYNPTLGGYNYELLHSTSRYEKQNRQWELVLYSDAPNEVDGNSIDATSVGDNFNRRAREYFEDNN